MGNSAEERLKAALTAGDFQEAQRLLPLYSHEVTECLEGSTNQQQKRQALETFHNLLSLARVMRAHLSTQLSKLQRQVCYRYEVPTAEKHSWNLEG